MKISKLTTFYILLTIVVTSVSLPYVEGSQYSSGHRELRPDSIGLQLQFDAGIGQTFDLKFWNIRGTFVLNVLVTRSKVSTLLSVIQTINSTDFRLTYLLNSSSTIYVSLISVDYSAFDYSISISGMRNELLIAPTVSTVLTLFALLFEKQIFWKVKRLRDSKFLEVVREELRGISAWFLGALPLLMYFQMQIKYLGAGDITSTDFGTGIFNADSYRYDLTMSLVQNFGIPVIAVCLVVLSVNKVGVSSEAYRIYPIDPRSHYSARLTVYTLVIVPYFTVPMTAMAFRSHPGYGDLVPYYLPSSLTFLLIIFFAVFVQLLIWDLFPRKIVVSLLFPTFIFFTLAPYFYNFFPFTLFCNCSYDIENVPENIPSLGEFILVPLLKDIAVVAATLLYRSTPHYRLN